MTHQVPESYRSVSMLLCNILDDVGYSRADRDKKVRIVTECEVFMNMGEALDKSELRLYLFGSRGEGSTGPGLQSDTDFVGLDETYKVVTDLADTQSDKRNFLLVKDNLTHPGYVKLQQIGITPDLTAVPIYHDESNNSLATFDTLNRCVLSNKVHHQHGNVSGPAVNTPANDNGYSTDMVFALRCLQWPREGYEWFERRRFFGWPTPRQIRNAWEYGCFATPVGHPHSFELDLEWRLSFSIAERDLTRSFGDVEMKVYILLKMIKKTFIEPVLKDAFSSYQCKVCMLWMRERTPRELWSNENLLYCLILCIRQLYEWATVGFCPDYFIVTNNIYDRKIIGAKRFGLVTIISNLLLADCRFLLGIKCCSLGQLLTNRIGGMDIYHISNTPLISEEVDFYNELRIKEACSCIYAILKNIPQHYPTLLDYLERIIYASKHMSYIMQYPLKHAIMVLYALLGFHIATICKTNACFLSREQADCLVAVASGCLSLGINSDVTSVRLKLCGLGMELENYDLTEVCLQHISDYRMSYIYSATVDMKCYTTVLKCNLKSCLERFPLKTYSTEELLKNQVSFSVVYMPSEISITPTPLRIEMFRAVGVPLQLRDKFGDCWYDWAVVDSLICLYFFQYLNFSRQGKERHAQAAINNMIHFIRTEPDILHRDTAFNLLGYSFMQEKEMTNAFECFTKSLNIRPYHNAAKFYLGILFKRVCATHRRHVPY